MEKCISPMTLPSRCRECGTTERLGKNSKGVIHCASCCKENNDETGLSCEPIRSS
jgi:hypothetical protein